MDDIKALMGDIAQAYKQEKRQQKSNDIICFIADHWKLFTRTRADMMAVVGELGNRLPYTVDALCDGLGLPNNVFFKRMPVKDVAAAILNFPRSPLLDLFLKCKEVSYNKEACLVLVAGTRSIVITNMQTSFDNCQYDIWFRNGEDELHIFKIDDAPLRLPNLFNPKEKSYE